MKSLHLCLTVAGILLGLIELYHYYTEKGTK
jgi:hypothetical protein